MDAATAERLAWLRFLVPLLALGVPWAIGAWIERRHLRSLARRERVHGRFPVSTLEAPDPDFRVGRVGLVTGSVVVSLDHWKRFAAAIRGIFGGRVPGFETLLARGRREALLRLVESARAAGYHAVVNVRLETASLATMQGDGKGTSGVEVLAFGTGLRRRR